MNEPTYNYTAFQDHFWHFYRDEDAAEGARAEAIKKEPAVIWDRIRSNLIGGAAGDALGYPVEFFSWNTIVNKYGKYKVHGIVEYKLDPKTGLALFSDDTQMTLFTANGILVNETPKAFDGSEDKLKSCMYEAYLEWWRTQRNPFPHVYKWRSSWLMDVPSLYENRGPGRTCLTSLDSSECGSIKHPLNTRSGNGGLMRVAPYGCYFRDMPAQDLILAAAESTAITHGNSLGYIPSGMMALIVRECIYGENKRLCDIIENSYRATAQVFSGDNQWHRFAELMDPVLLLSRNSSSDITNIRSIGSGTTGDTALAISVYCSLKYEQDFSGGIFAAVNHDGDSDSTGAITGNLLGAYLGLDNIENKWLDKLVRKELIFEITDDLCYGVPTDDEPERRARWTEKYVKMHAPEDMK